MAIFGRHFASPWAHPAGQTDVRRKRVSPGLPLEEVGGKREDLAASWEVTFEGPGCGVLVGVDTFAESTV